MWTAEHRTIVVIPTTATWAPAYTSLPQDLQCPHRSQLAWRGHSAGTRQRSRARHMLICQPACPRTASFKINQLLHRGTPSSFQIPIFTKLIGAHGVSGTCAFLLIWAKFVSNVQALTACSVEDHLFNLLKKKPKTKQNRKWAFTGAGKALLQALYQCCLPPGELVRHNKHTHGYIYMIFCHCVMSLKAVTRRQALANELLKQSCSVISWMLLNPPLALKNKHCTTQTAWQKKITSKLCLGCLGRRKGKGKGKGGKT